MRQGLLPVHDGGPDVLVLEQLPKHGRVLRLDQEPVLPEHELRPPVRRRAVADETRNGGIGFFARRDNTARMASASRETATAA